ncbi:hypothetical protein AVEN_59170-1 [Araneus ventricosus]|uniref:Uncharacterized protein n=1 Tax=Araneus ventricosus TaxID=182803 RepID=A0A4Y2IR31_ARAVE|nr:hypothetical protein AVEN_59170-1 [Araneus ventricosus]
MTAVAITRVLPETGHGLSPPEEGTYYYKREDSIPPMTALTTRSENSLTYIYTTYLWSPQVEEVIVTSGDKNQNSMRHSIYLLKVLEELQDGDG